MAVYACTNCGWVRRLEKEGSGERCESCGAVACCLTPSGDLGHRRARLAAASARALHRQSLGVFESLLGAVCELGASSHAGGWPGYRTGKRFCTEVRLKLGEKKKRMRKGGVKTRRSEDLPESLKEEALLYILQEVQMEEEAEESDGVLDAAGQDMRPCERVFRRVVRTKE